MPKLYVVATPIGNLNDLTVRMREAIEAADLVLMNDRLSDFVTALRIAQKTVGIVKQNIVLAIGVKVGVMILLALMSVLPPLAPLAGFAGTFAVFADVGVSVIAILNAMRAMKI